MRVKKEKAKKSWTRDDLKRAVLKVRRGQSLKSAAQECNINRSTLRSRLKRGVPAGPTQGKRLLTDYEESQLNNFVKYMADSGAPMTPLRLRQLARSLMSKM